MQFSKDSVQTGETVGSILAMVASLGNVETGTTSQVTVTTTLNESHDCQSIPKSSGKPQISPPHPGKKGLVFGSPEQAGWTDVFASPTPQAMRLGQVLIGDLIKVLTRQGSWSKIEIPEQQYTGWVRTAHLTSDAQLVQCFLTKGTKYIVVQAPGITVDEKLFLPFGSILPLHSKENGQFRFLLPDRRSVLLSKETVRPLDAPLTLKEALERIKSFHQTPYQRGANTWVAMDGAGLIHLLFRVIGIIVPRDLTQLIKTGEQISLDKAQAGDVIFFSTFDPNQSRPVILLDNNSFIEAYPARGIGFGLLERLHQRKVLAVRRYTTIKNVDIEEPPTVQQLLIQCKNSFESKYFTTNPHGGETAWECYNHVLRLDSKNAEASDGLKAIENAYIKLFEQALQDDQLDKAQTYMSRLKQVNPESPALSRLQAQLDRAP
ncbi:hypothetical protein PN36_06300 [Candidatus Thiomargarita nelsonii]|uniref:NlpC/P60 domain-containing protein n=1 Tax=Candidatus Thiomargarita nelsonii TaxID=1003181 RepID=A0A0A6PKF8_9GAMM|nr:hypothetical protein PN36_06300 [Candidatus Thiomargarita nelsonii]